MKYELDCECGKKVVVSAGDAGMTVNCGCGKPVVVPGLGELKRLRPGRPHSDDSDDEESEDADGRRGLIGLILVAAGMITSCVTSALKYDTNNPNGLAVNDILFWSICNLALSATGTALFASARGHPFIIGAILGTLCGPFGLLILLMLPSRNR